MELFGKNYNVNDLLAYAKKDGHQLCGYYNENYQINLDGHECVVRQPITGADEMDLGFVHEEAVLRCVREKTDIPVPEVYAVSTEPYFYVEEFLQGDVLNDTHPRGTLVPGHFIDDVVRLKNALWQMDYSSLTKCFPKDWPTGDDVAGFYKQEENMVRKVYNRFKDSYKKLYEAFGMPSDPFEYTSELGMLLTRRPLVLGHCDIHRKNVIIKDGVSWFLDWEKALITDPVYDVAVHIHKMYYTPDEQMRFLNEIKLTVPAHFINGMDKDVERHLILQRVKSLIIDTVRTHRHVIDPNESPDVQDYVVNQYARKINQVQSIWGGRLFSPEEICKKMTLFVPE